MTFKIETTTTTEAPALAIEFLNNLDNFKGGPAAIEARINKLDWIVGLDVLRIMKSESPELFKAILDLN